MIPEIPFLIKAYDSLSHNPDANVEIKTDVFLEEKYKKINLEKVINKTFELLKEPRFSSGDIKKLQTLKSKVMAVKKSLGRKEKKEGCFFSQRAREENAGVGHFESEVRRSRKEG